MSINTAQVRSAAGEAGNCLLTAGTFYVAAYPYFEMFAGGEPLFRLVVLAMASLFPSLMTLKLVLKSPDLALDPAMRRYFPTCAALLASTSVSYPGFLMTGLPLG